MALWSLFFACKADNHVGTQPESTGGLAYGTGGGTGGMTVGTGGLALDAGSTGGMTVGTGGLALDAGSTGGMTVGTGGLAIGTGGGVGGVAVGSGGLALGTGGGIVGTGGLAIGTGGGTGGVTIGSGGATGGANGGSTGSCATDLTGTWDLVATSSYGSTRPGVFVISGDTFSLSVTTGFWQDSPSTKQLSYSSAGARTLTWSRPGDPVIPIDVQYTPANLDMGSIPLAVGGQWVFAVNHTKCSAAIDSTSTILCQNNPAGKRVGGTWPFPIPLPRPNTTYTLTRTSQLASQFGFLGGQWQTRSSSSPEACTMKVEGATVTILCKTTDGLNGSAQVTVGADCIASGTTNNGWELSARRR